MGIARWNDASVGAIAAGACGAGIRPSGLKCHMREQGDERVVL